MASHTFFRHAGMVCEIALIEALLRGVGSEQHDVARLNAIAAEFTLGLFEIGDCDLIASQFMRKVQDHTVAITVINRNSLGAWGVGFDVTPRVDVRTDVIAGDDHAVIGDFVDTEVVGTDADGHFAMCFHLDNGGLG